MFFKIKRTYNNLPVQMRASLWAFICGILQKGISVLTTPIFTRLLSTAEFGSYNVFNSWMGIISILISFCFYYGVFDQGLVKFEDEKKIFTSSLLGLALILEVIWTLIYFLFRDYLNNFFSLSTIQMSAMLSLIWLSTVFNFWAAVQKNDYKYKALILVTLSVAIFSPTISFFLIKASNDKVTARVFGVLIVEAFAYLWMFFSMMLHGKCFINLKFWKYALVFNLPLIPHYFSQVVLNVSDRIMIERICGDSYAGIYSLAYSISLMMIVFNTAIMQTLSPWLYRKIKSKHIEDIDTIAYSSLVGIGLVNILLVLIAPEAVRLFAPAEYYEAIWIIPPVSISAFYMFCYDLFARFAFYYEKRFFITIASVAGALLNIVLNYIFIKKFGYIAAGYTTLVCYMVYAFGHYIFMNKVCDKFCDGVRPYNTKTIILISSAFTVSGLLLLFTYNHIIIRYSILALIIVLAILLHKKIIYFIKSILNLKKSDA